MERARKLFVAALPGFILGFFILRSDADIPALERYPLLLLFVSVSVGLFFAVEAVLPLSSAMVAVAYAALALNIFYWFAGPILVASFAYLTGINVGWFRWVISALILVVTLLWIARTRVSELQFAWTTGTRTEPVLLMPPKVAAASQQESPASVRFESDGAAVAAEIGTSLLEIAELNNQPIEAGCGWACAGRPGCGARRHVVSYPTRAGQQNAFAAATASASRPGWHAARGSSREPSRCP